MWEKDRCLKPHHWQLLNLEQKAVVLLKWKYMYLFFVILKGENTFDNSPREEEFFSNQITKGALAYAQHFSIRDARFQIKFLISVRQVLV